jgi:hypothetical protein
VVCGFFILAPELLESRDLQLNFNEITLNTHAYGWKTVKNIKMRRICPS